MNKTLWMMILVPLLYPPGPVMAQTIELMPQATVDSEQMTLSQIARVHSPVNGEADAVGKAAVGNAPAVGASTTLTLAAVREALAAAGVNRAVWTIQGASACRIARVEGPARQIEQLQQQSAAIRAGLAGPVVSMPEPTIPDSLAGCVQKMLQDQYQVNGARLALQFEPADRSVLALQRPQYRFEIAIRRATERSVEVAVRVYLAGNPRSAQAADAAAPATPVEAAEPAETFVKSVELRVRAELSAPVVVAARALNRGQVIGADDVQLAPRQIGLTSTACRDLSAVVGQQAVRVLKPEDTVMSGDLAPLALVHRNKAVTVWSRQGGLLLKTVGRAMADGVYGEKILVRNEVSREAFYGIVTGPDTVELDPTPVQETRKPGGPRTPGASDPKAPPTGVSPRTPVAAATDHH